MDSLLPWPLNIFLCTIFSLPTQLLSTGACRCSFLLRGLCLLLGVLQKLAERGGAWGTVLKFGLFKTSYGCTLQEKNKGSVKHTGCSQNPLILFLKSAAHFLNNPNAKHSANHPSAQTVCQNTKRSHITTKGWLGAAGKARNAGAGNWWKGVWRSLKL